MESIRQYILSVISAAILCGFVQMLFSGGNSPAVKMITGLIVTITVIGPFIGDSNLQFKIDFDKLTMDSEWVVKEGEELAMAAASERITESTETYILDKAKAMGAVIAVDVQLTSSKPLIPEIVKIKGTVSPYIKKQLTECLRQDLGIAEENQIWIS